MFLAMRHHCRARYKAFATDITSVRTLSSVQPLVYGHRGELCEALTTDITSVRPLACVTPAMAAQSIPTSKCFPTNLAHKTLLSCMHGRVDTQVYSCQKSLSTDLKNRVVMKIVVCSETEILLVRDLRMWPSKGILYRL